MRKLTFLLACLMLVGVGLVNAQSKSISGKVVSGEDGQPIIGATVKVKGASTGTITNASGQFTVTLKGNEKTLVVSYIGMKTTEVEAKQNIVVALESDALVMDEVLVVAYGTAKKSAFTGSASVVKSDEIGKIQTSNVASALVGKVAGVQMASASGQPGATTPTIRVRGVTSINAGNAPLIILDGVPYDGDLNDINSQDVESMTVLKDAASNALYGARGANGVIIITTKKGVEGSKVTLDAKWGVNTRATQDYKLVKSPAQYYEMYYGGLKNYFVNSQGYTNDQAYVMANNNLTASNDYGLAYNVYSVPTGQYMIGTNGKLNSNATLGNVVSFGGKSYLLKPDNWLDEAYKQGIRQEYNLSISSGTSQSSFYASLGYLNNEGITQNSNYERIVGRLKADSQIKSWLKIGGNMAFAHSNINKMSEDGINNSSGNIFAIATQVAPIYPLYIRDRSGNVMYDGNGIKMYDYADKGNAGLVRPEFSNSNALSDAILNKNSANGNALNASGFAEIRFLKDFKFTTTNNINLGESRSTQVTNPYYGSYASSLGIVDKAHDRLYSFSIQQLLDYTKSIDLNHVNVMLGHEYYRTTYDYLSASKSNMFDPSNYELAGAITDGSMNSYETVYNTEGYFTRAQYDYDSRYFASASFRRDASSRFAPDNRWGNFWSAGGAWLINKESWLNTSWIDVLKAKVSYGQQGNDNIGNYLYTNTKDIVNAQGHAATTPLTMGNKNITWESVNNFNAGIDFEFFKSRISGDIEYFSRKTSDMLFSFPLSPSYGYTSYYANIGDNKNSGLEIALDAAVFKTKDFVWNVNVNFTKTTNKVTYLPEERKTMNISGVKGYSSGNLYYGEGIPMYTFYLKQYAGVDDKGQSLFYKDIKDASGKITGRDKTTVYSDGTYYLSGTALPDAYGGFGTSLTYKGFDFSISFAYQLGGQVYDGDYASAMASPTKGSRGFAFHADLLNAWSEQNKSSNIPRLQYGDSYSASTSDRFLTDASYLSLQNINLGYTLSKKVSKFMGIEKLRAYMVCDNVWLWSKRQGLDPRQSISGSSTASYYSPIRSISGGLTLTF